MSSSPESITKGEEKKGNLENNPKDDMPKETSTMESKGARPKTSSTPIKSEKQTEENKPLKVVIINANGPNMGNGTTETRKYTIQNVIFLNKPELILFQEFTAEIIDGKVWSSNLVLKHYKFTGSNKHSSVIVYNSNELFVTENTEIEKDFQTIFQGDTSKHSELNHNKSDISSRMCLRVVKIKDKTDTDFICISWHGKHSGMTNVRKVTEFKTLMKVLNAIYNKYKLPILIGGDFNVVMKLIRPEVNDLFKLYPYTPSVRRKEKVIDYFITSPGLHLYDMKPVDLKKVSKLCIIKLIYFVIKYLISLDRILPVLHVLVQLKVHVSQAEIPENVLDHDPIQAKLIPPPLDNLPGSSSSE
ncbi:hypothetical protein ACJMK2_034596 [Sinanodonta woodiana]|uniref:Endonuclease/exonuclease/phosphatase domain-containing protein n=1 Tax=Sinanodonta woodiana TaxID=1069815 RepID=A0ABD3WVN1_SINWO